MKRFGIKTLRKSTGFLGVVFSKRFGNKRFRKNDLEASRVPRDGFLKRSGIETLQKISSRLLGVPRGSFLKRFGIETVITKNCLEASRLLGVPRGCFLKRSGIETFQNIILRLLRVPQCFF